MKQSAVKTLGVAALGAAFAAAGAGAANAAPAVPDPTRSVDTVTSAVPGGDVATTLPAGGAEALPAAPAAPTADLTAPVTDLAGGVPAADLIGGLPAGQLPIQGPGLPAV
jgi:hypothetical protein